MVDNDAVDVAEQACVAADWSDNQTHLAPPTRARRPLRAHQVPGSPSGVSCVWCGVSNSRTYKYNKKEEKVSFQTKMNEIHIHHIYK